MEDRGPFPVISHKLSTLTYFIIICIYLFVCVNMCHNTGVRVRGQLVRVASLPHGSPPCGSWGFNSSCQYGEWQAIKMSRRVISTAVLRQTLSLGPRAFQLVWLASEPRRGACLQFLGPGITRMCHHTLLLSQGFWGVSASPHVCMSRTLPAVPSFQPNSSIFYLFDWINYSCSISVALEPSADGDVPTHTGRTVG